MAPQFIASGNDAETPGSRSERYRRVFDNSPDGIVLFHAGSAFILDMNRRAAEMLGYSPKEVTAFRVPDFPPFQPAGAGRRIFEGCHNGGPLYWEERLAPKSGGQVDCEILGTAYWEAGQRAVQLNLRRIASHKLERLAGGVAHRFNNLLTAIMGNAGLAAADLPRDSREVLVIAKILEAAVQGAELTQSLLAYAGLEEATPEMLSLSDLIFQTARQFDSLIPPRVSVRLGPAPNLPPVKVDRRQMERVILSLVLNGVEAIPGGGKVEVRAFVKALAPADLQEFVKPHALCAGRFVCLEVEDTGTGIPDGIRPHIFDPFFSTKFAGRGLGLAAVAGIVRRHGGGIQVACPNGRGSAFRVYLPVPGPTAMPPAGRRSADLPPGSPR